MRPPTSAPRSSRREARLNDALQAEWTKLRTVPGPTWLLLAVITLTVAVGAATTATVECSFGGCDVDQAKTSLTGIVLGQVAVAVLAVLMIGSEYGTGMIHITLTAVPGRIVVLAAKALVLTGVVITGATIAVLGSLLAGRLILPGHGVTPSHGYPPLSLGDGPVLRAALGSVLYLALIALLALGIAFAVRDSATAIGIVFGLLYVFPIITLAVSDPQLRRHLQQIAPMNAGLAIQATNELSKLPIGPWAGLGVLAAWAGAALLVGGLLLRRRDA
jgi:ABC-2 type transport system permease protein